MKKIKIVFLIILFLGCILYTNVLENQEVTVNELEIQQDSGEHYSKVLLYFLNEENELVPEYRFVSLDDLKGDIHKLLITELLKGPNVKENKSALPKDVKLISIKNTDTSVSVNFSKEYNSQNEKNPTNKIMAVVNTLTEIKEIDTVEILVEGEMYDVRGREKTNI